MKKAVICGVVSVLLAQAAYAGDYRQTVYKYPSDGVVQYMEGPVHVYCTDCGEVAPLEAAPAISLSLKVAEEVPATEPSPASCPTPVEQTETQPQPLTPAGHESPTSSEKAPEADASTPQLKELPGQTVVYFDFNKSDLTEETKGTLLGLRKGAYDLTGFTDDAGSQKINNKVARQRAETVAEFLKSNGYAIRSVNDKGKCCYIQQVESGQPDRAKSRRVEVILAKERQSALIGITPLMRVMAMVNSLSVGVLENAKDAEADFKKTFPQINYQDFRRAVIPGLWEVAAGNNVFYYAPGGKLLIGDIIDNTGQNLTAKRREEMIISKLQTLPLDKAVRIGNGPKVVVEISDPDCPFCRSAEQVFSARDDVTRYVFLIALPMHREAPAKINSILCAAEQDAQYREIVSGKFDGKDVPVNAECGDNGQSLAAEHEKVAKELGANGTPLFFLGGKRVDGANTALIEQLLNQK